ncbi:ribosomal RNA small subunit methyltransferase H [Desulfuromonas versatilis]|uniref:Ribosomal RNA small subunit methyltransferase H n=1 Tax=Desulfuromonas versatilis TaxID=2802975 RepID=A0ABM8HQB0_9BACT|nr:16S rRNA (cytosine(1402)-N(4))-methyltransferase RsmH [Desulfuromonas versatilis]BCR03954.1 ribosomal RNA small subunit methyltransferase H [Desulfuromonas versatilis]
MAQGDFSHLSVMPGEVLELLQPRAGETYLDGTLGGGGHSRLILEASAPDGRLIGLDRDPAALRKAAEVLAPFGERAILRHANFSEAGRVLAELGIAGLDGMLLDLGVSSHQLDSAERGFSFRAEAPLDMRMDPTGGETAADVVNTYSADDLARIFREYGEERYAGRIARRIEKVRQQALLESTRELAELVRDAVPGGHIPSRIHPATRVFQALRIQVNQELEHVREGIARGLELLKPGGRLVVISFHSLEDRIVKRFFQEQAKGCICPPRLPTCVCGHQPGVEILTRKAARAGEQEVAGNPRARSAVLRAVRKLA